MKLTTHLYVIPKVIISGALLVTSAQEQHNVYFFLNYAFKIEWMYNVECDNDWQL